MKIKYTTTIEIDDSKICNLSKSYVIEEVKKAMDSIVTAMETSDFEIKYLIDENADAAR